MGTETTDSDAEYATTGPFALFSLSAPAENARIAQSAAGAQLLEGEQTLRVDYDDDAAPTDGESYYEVELFFEDGSTKTIGLTASETGVSVAASDYAEYQALIEEMEEPATERGFEATPEGLIEYPRGNRIALRSSSRSSLNERNNCSASSSSRCRTRLRGYSRSWRSRSPRSNVNSNTGGCLTGSRTTPARPRGRTSNSGRRSASTCKRVTRSISAKWTK